MFNIVIIGAGQLGSRHLQSLAKMDISISIEVVDPNGEQLKIAKERFGQASQNFNVQKVHYCNVLNDTRLDFDLCIIATTADIRGRVTKELLNTKKVKNIIFEKVLFQSLSDYDEIQELLMKNKVNAWVNCPRRMYPFYYEIKKYFKSEERISYHITGGDWGLASNAIHCIDNMAFYNGIYDYDVDISNLDQEIYSSKRKGFIELGGTLKITSSNKSELILHSKKYSNAPEVISILGETCHAIVLESLGKAFIARSNNDWQWQEINFRVPYQSELTHLAATEILLKRHCSLTPFGDSAKLHKTLIAAFLHHIELISHQKSNDCPIT